MTMDLVVALVIALVLILTALWFVDDATRLDEDEAHQTREARWRDDAHTEYTVMIARKANTESRRDPPL